jgi:hypothetical protein
MSALGRPTNYAYDPSLFLEFDNEPEQSYDQLHARRGNAPEDGNISERVQVIRTPTDARDFHVDANNNSNAADTMVYQSKVSYFDGLSRGSR